MRLLLSALCVLATLGSAESMEPSLRARRLPGGFDYDFDMNELEAAEIGFLAGLIFVVILACMLCSCCCRASRGCSLCDILAIFCLWEMCCDRDGVSTVPGDFVLI